MLNVILGAWACKQLGHVANLGIWVSYLIELYGHTVKLSMVHDRIHVNLALLTISEMVYHS